MALMFVFLRLILMEIEQDPGYMWGRGPLDLQREVLAVCAAEVMCVGHHFHQLHSAAYLQWLPSQFITTTITYLALLWPGLIYGIYL